MKWSLYFTRPHFRGYNLTIVTASLSGILYPSIELWNLNKLNIFIRETRNLQMNRTIIGSMLCLIVMNASGQKAGLNKWLTPKLRILGVDNNLINNNLKGNVLSVKERNWYMKMRNGKLVKSKLYFSMFYKYDSMGNEILKIEMDKDGWYKGDTIISSHSYKYDQAGRIIEMYESIKPTANDTSFFTKTVCKYNEKGELIEQNTYNSRLDPDGHSIYKYDSLGNLTVSEYYGQSKESSDKTIFRYDIDKLVGEVYYQPADTLDLSTTIKYDRNGNRSDTYKGFKYKATDYIRTTKYDQNGYVVEQTTMSKAGKITWSGSHKYTYDAHGNFIRELYSEYRKKPVLSERVIEYYNLTTPGHLTH